MVNTKFWSDNFIRESLNPLDRYLFLYFLTNEKTNIAGIYELPLSTISYETGLEKTMLTKMFRRLRDRVCYYRGWVILKNFLKYQNLGSPEVKKGVENALGDVPAYIKQKVDSLRWSIDGLRTSEEYELEFEPKSELKSKPIRREVLNKVISYFYQLKGWDKKDKSFYEKNKIVYSRHAKPAKDLLELCDGDADEANICLDKLAKWAISRDLDWSIETVFKKWYDLDLLKEKEKKPYIDGQRAFEMRGKWHLIDRTGEIKEYVGSLKNIEYK